MQQHWEKHRKIARLLVQLFEQRFALAKKQNAVKKYRNHTNQNSGRVGLKSPI